MDLVTETEMSKGIEPKIVDMAPLIGRVRDLINGLEEQSINTATAIGQAALVDKYGFVAKGRGRPEMILAEDVAVELGHPSTASQALVLMTFEKELIRSGQITWIGPDLSEKKEGARLPLGQVVMLSVNKDLVPDPFDMENRQFLTNRLPGHMVRSVPGQLWIRISKEARERGLDLRIVGSALVAAYLTDFEGVTGAEVLFVTSDNESVRALEPLAAEARILAGQHKKLVLDADGQFECSDLACETCDEKPVCDNLKDVVIKRRRKQDG